MALVPGGTVVRSGIGHMPAHVEHKVTVLKHRVRLSPGLVAIVLGLLSLLNADRTNAGDSLVLAAQEDHRRIPLPDNVFALDNKLSCGPRCVHFLLQVYNRDVPYEDVLRDCSPGANGTSLKQLQDCLKSHGLHVLPLSGPAYQAARQLNQPMIARLQSTSGSGHFVVIIDWDEASGEVLVYNPPVSYGHVPASEFAPSLSDISLVVSDKLLPSVDELNSGRGTNLLLTALTAVSASLLLAAVWRLSPNNPLGRLVRRK